MSNVITASCILILLVYTWRVLNWVWFRPKNLEKCLRKQGFKGNSHRILQGDLREFSESIKEAKSKPINLSDDIAPRLMPFFLQTIKKYGKDSFIWFGPTPLVFITKPEHLKEILAKNYIYQKPRSHNPLTKLLTQGLATLEEDKWTKHRKIINPAFRMEKLKHMLPAFKFSCGEMLKTWEEVVSVKGSCEIDIWPHLLNMSGEVISHTAFGSSSEEGRRIFQLQQEQANLVMEAAMSIYIPGWRFFPTKRNTRMKEIEKQLQESIRHIINRRLKEIKAGEESHNDLLGILLESNLKEIEQLGNNNFGMTIGEIVEECKLFYFAGQETAAVLLVWTMVLLCQYPHWQAHAREEVFNTFGNDEPNFQGLNHLKIVTMILHECSRLYPPLPWISRWTKQECKLGEVHLPAGVQLLLPTYLLQRDEELWGEDAKEFKPERFNEGVSKATKGQFFSFFPFSWGPRICIGQNFAMLQAKIALAMILQRFSFELSPTYAHAPFALLTVQPQHGAPLLLHKL